MTTVYPPGRYDDWYHLAVIRAFSEQGFTTHAWWQYQPPGRPHLYPPLLHLVGAQLVLQTPLTLAGVNRLFNIVTFPLGMGMMWMGIRLLLGSKTAFWFVLLLGGELTIFYPASIMILPSSWVLFSIPLLMWSILHGHKVLAIILLTGGMYTHLGIPVIIFLALGMTALFHRELRKTVTICTLSSLLLFSPWLSLIVANHDAFTSAHTPFGLQIPLLLWLIGILGCVTVWKRGLLEERIWIYVSVALLLFLPRYAHRFWPYVGISLSVLGAIWLVGQKSRQATVLRVLAVIGCTAGQVYVLAPHSVIAASYLHRSGIQFCPSPLSVLLTSLGRGENPLDGDARSRWVEENTQPEDIIVLENEAHEGDRIFALTGRRTTTGGWVEVRTPGMERAIRDFIESGDGVRIPSDK